MAMYFILRTKKPKVGCCTILVRPFCPVDPDSSSPTLLRRFRQRAPGHISLSWQKGKELAGPTASLKSRTDTPLPSQESRTPSLAQAPSVALGTLPTPTAPASAVVTPQREPARAAGG